MNILIIDNYDSFTYNIVEAIRSLGYECDVKRNDEVSLEQVADYEKIIISPGPGIPAEAGNVPQILKKYYATKSILGICLGHQAIGESFGATLENMKQVIHGFSTPITIIEDDYIFTELTRVFTAGRYHSWIIKNKDIPQDIVVTAMSENGEIMAIRHRSLDIHGVQFHPESILTPEGIKIIENFIKH